MDSIFFKVNAKLIIFFSSYGKVTNPIVLQCYTTSYFHLLGIQLIFFSFCCQNEIIFSLCFLILVWATISL